MNNCPTNLLQAALHRASSLGREGRLSHCSAPGRSKRNLTSSAWQGPARRNGAAGDAAGLQRPLVLVAQAWSLCRSAFLCNISVAPQAPAGSFQQNTGHCCRGCLVLDRCTAMAAALGPGSKTHFKRLGL